ncbi:hypothetical protein EXIGLDRAFT_833146 [Exidia glandulosa HHB12029]|uniref:F-box domain-containing protein n=1 Tax=Exidia glandulosa HHB12029 TaxID=1314781 RepID=A0A165KWW1_EXIGL|nr:hypothetical protein EXIGLDRAFT_833146 [Exidia glandulosa HHB12029]
MLGPSTRAVVLEALDVPYADVLHLLERTPSLSDLRMEGDILDVPHIVSRKIIGHAMHLLDISYNKTDALEVLQRILPIDQIHNVTVSTWFADDGLEPWLGFLHFSGSAPSFMQLHTWDKRWCKFSIANDKDSADFKTRTITTARSLLSRLPSVLQLHSAHFLSTLRTIDVDVMHWAELLDMIASAPLDRSLDVLEEIRISADPTLLRIYPHLDLELRDYDGPTISFPQLKVLEIVLLGYDPSSNQLVRRLLRAVQAISFLPDVALRVTRTRQTWQDAAEAQTFVDAVMRILEEIVEEDADPDEVAPSYKYARPKSRRILFRTIDHPPRKSKLLIMRVLAIATLVVSAVVSASAQCWTLTSGTIVCPPIKANLTGSCVELLSGSIVC